jgi:FlaA1/EpsC-like NDP-sugar epimerase
MKKMNLIMAVMNLTALAVVMFAMFTSSTMLLALAAIVMVQWMNLLWIENSRLARRIEALERATRPSATPADLP